MASNSALPASLTYLRLIHTSVAWHDIFENVFPDASARSDFQSLIQLIQKCVNLTSLRLDEIRLFPTSTVKNSRRQLTEEARDIHSPQSQNEFALIDAFVSLPCWQRLTHVSSPMIPWHRFAQYDEYRRSEYNDASASFVPQSLSRLTSPLRLQSPIDEPMDVKIAHALYYCPRDFLPPQCRVRNVMILDNSDYVDRLGHRLSSEVVAIQEAWTGVIETMANVNPPATIPAGYLAQWQTSKQRALQLASTWTDMLNELAFMILAPTDYEALKAHTTDWIQRAKTVSEQFLQFTTLWQQCCDFSTSAQHAKIAAFSDTMHWMMTVLAQVALLPQSLLVDVLQVVPVLEHLRAIQSEKYVDDAIMPYFAEPMVYLEIKTIAIGKFIDSRTTIFLVNPHIALMESFELAKMHGTTATSTFDASIIMPIFVDRREPRNLPFA